MISVRPKNFLFKLFSFVILFCGFYFVYSNFFDNTIVDNYADIQGKIVNKNAASGDEKILKDLKDTVKEHNEIRMKNRIVHVKKLNHNTDAPLNPVKNESYDYFEDLLGYVLAWNNSINLGNGYLQTHLSFLDRTHDLMIKEQILETHTVTQRPIALSLTLNCNNSEYASFLNGKLRETPEHLIDLIIVAYEMSVLEMRLFELYDAVDEFIIFETNITFKGIRKPFFFQQNMQRFRRFLGKVTLITPFNVTTFNHDGSILKIIQVDLRYIPNEYKYQKVDDVPVLQDETNYFKIDWKIESQVRKIPLDLYSRYIRNIHDNELIVHGDVDEMPTGEILYHFKYCDVKQELYPFNFWSTFYTYGFKYFFQADFSAQNDPYSNLFPNIFRLKDILEKQTIRTTSGFVLPRASGAHTNRFFTTFTIPLYKDMSQSDSEGMENFHLNIIKNCSKVALYGIEELFNQGSLYEKYINRIKPFDFYSSNQTQYGKIFVPWIVRANPSVYKKFFRY